MENEQKQGLVKSAETRLPKFVEDAYESVEKMERFAEILLNSKLVPFHFFEKLPDGKPDFTKGKVPAVVAVLIQGYQLQLPPLTALQHIIPVNGLLSIKGDLAKSMIFNSGKLKPGSWLEEESGSIEAGDYMVKITATRSDNGQTLSRSFSVGQAKRAGLWITEQQVNGQDGWKYKSSAWWKYPSRMCNYRALGFIARDMFPDVMAGIYTTEEAMDIPKDVTETIETESGAKITIPDKEHAQKRSGKMTDRVADKIPENKFGEVKKDNIQEATVMEDTVNVPDPPVRTDESPFKTEKGSVEYMDGKEVKRDEKTEEHKEEVSVQTGKYSLKQLEDTDTKILLQMVNDDTDMIEACEMIGGKNTNRKLREIVFAHQEGKLAEHVAPFMDKNEQAPPTGGEMQPNKDFDKQGAKTLEDKEKEIDDFLDTKPKIKEPVKTGNKYDLEIPEFDKGNSREFSVAKNLFNKFMGIEPQITTPRYLTLAEKLNFLTKYPDKERFVKEATTKEINDLLNAN